MKKKGHRHLMTVHLTIRERRRLVTALLVLTCSIGLPDCAGAQTPEIGGVPLRLGQGRAEVMAAIRDGGRVLFETTGIEGDTWSVFRSEANRQKLGHLWFEGGRLTRVQRDWPVEEEASAPNVVMTVLTALSSVAETAQRCWLEQGNEVGRSISQKAIVIACGNHWVVVKHWTLHDQGRAVVIVEEFWGR